MFTQSEKINVSRCNGCPSRCLLGASATITYLNTTKYRPTITHPDNMHLHIRHKKSRQHMQNLFPNIAQALSVAKTASTHCSLYITPMEQQTTSNIETQCHGCEHNCPLVAKKIQTPFNEIKFLPKIGTKTIKKYIQKKGTITMVPGYDSALVAFKNANHISKLCDKYQHQHVRPR